MKDRHEMRTAASVLLVLLLLTRLTSCSQGDQTDFEQLLAEGESLYSHKKQELIIRHFFRDRRDGIFLDVGCFNPIKFSTTYYLEKHLDWSGIGVDAQEHLRAKWEVSRPRSEFFAYVVTDKSGETVTFYQFGGISALDRENIAKRERRDNKKKLVEVLELPTITLDDLLSREGVQNIDFLSMDINGSEPGALAGFDIKRYRPELVQIEAHEVNQEFLSSYFEENGYVRIDEYLEYDTNNWFFTPEAEE
jgi:FkbM family methyltransferase